MPYIRHVLRLNRLVCFLAGLAFFSGIALPSQGMDDLGPLATARKSHPAVFVEGNVLEYTVASVAGYVYNGSAERSFEGEQAESDAELYREASLDARKNLIHHLKKLLPDVSEIQLTGARKLYEYPEGGMRRVVWFVAKDDVSIVKQVVPAERSPPETESVLPRDGAPIVVPKCDKTCVAVTNPVETIASKVEPSVDILEMYMKGIAKAPFDCVLLGKAAKLNARRGNFAESSRLYASIVKNVISDVKIDSEFAADILLEAARFEAAHGTTDCALKYFRLVVNCDGMRCWNLNEQVDEAKKNISQLLLRVN